MENPYGAPVLRGRVLRADGEGRFVVKSIDQPGVVTLGLKAPQGQKIEEGSTVIYCEFADGQGAILMPI